MKVTKSALSYLLALALGGAACAKKPEKKAAEDLLYSKFEKSEFAEGKTFVVGETKGDVGKFIDAAKEKDQPNQYNLLAEEQKAFALLNEKDLVVFKIHEDALRMYFADDTERPIAKWSISSHCRVQTRLTEKGEETRYLETECADDSKSFKDYPLFGADWNKVQIRTMPNGFEDLVAKDTIESSARKFSFTAKEYIKKNQATEETAREIDEEKGLVTIKGSPLSRARELVVPLGFSGFNILNPVEFAVNIDLGTKKLEFNSQLLRDIEILGEVGQKYELLLQLTEHFLFVNKIVDESQLASTEKTFAEKLADGRFSVKIAGYPIQKYKLENSLTNGIKDVSIQPVAVPTLADADMIKIDANGVKKFSAQEKMDVFLADFLEDGSEWYFEKTVVDRPIDSVSKVLPFDFELGLQWSAGRVRVNKTKSSVQLVDVNIAEEAGDASGDQMQTVLEIPASWIDYRVSKSGSSAELVEEALDDGNPGATQWDKRKWVSFEFNRADNTRDSRSDSYKLNKLEVGEDYIGFEVYESDKFYNVGYDVFSDEFGRPFFAAPISDKPQVRFKYSLKRAKPSRPEGRTYYATDRNKFGYFARVKDTYGGTNKLYEDVSEKLVNVSRMYPEKDPKNGDKPTIWFHITDNSPSDSYIQEATQEAVDAWDRAFLKAAEGTNKEPISVKLAQARVGLGDVRYNKVAYYGYDRSSRLLGYGPSVTDPRSGEITIATNHIYLRNYREGIWRGFHHYVRNELGQFKDLNLKGIGKFFPEDGRFENIFPNQHLSKLYDVSGSSAVVLGRDQDNNPIYADDSMIAKELFTNLASPSVDISSGLTMYPTSLLMADAEFNKGSLQDAIHKEVSNRLEEEGYVDYEKLKSLPKTVFEALGKEGLSRYKNSRISVEPPYMNNNPSENWSSIALTGCSVGYTASNANTIADIKEYCDNESSGILFKTYMDGLRSQIEMGVTPENLITHTDEEEAAFTSCSNILLKKKLVATLVHEFGHNFGLRHNFAGSTDLENFPRDETGKIKFMTSSSMEYLGNDDDRGFEPGPYDVAALRYGYYDAVEVSEPRNIAGSSLEIVELKGRKIETAVKQDAPGKILKPYKYCSDSDTIGDVQLPLTDPNCRRHDRGVTPVERARDFIDSFNSFVMLNGSRFDRGNLGSLSLTVSAHLLPLKVIYDHYRLILNRDMGKTDPYFTNTANMQTIEDFVKNSKNEELKQYHEASKVIYEFLKALAYMPGSFCMVTSGNLERYYDYEALRNKVFSDTYAEFGVGTLVNKCEDAVPYLAERLKLSPSDVQVKRVGNLLTDLPWSPADGDLFDRPDMQRGLLFAKRAALEIIAMRSPTSGIAMVQNFRPSMLDDHRIKDEYVAALMDRITSGETKALLFEDGVQYKEMVNNTPRLAANESRKSFFESKVLPWRNKFRVPSFVRERSFLSASAKSFLTYVNSPLDRQDKSQPYRAIRVSTEDLGGFAQQAGAPADADPVEFLASQGFVWIEITNALLLAHPQINPVIFELIKSREDAQRLIRDVDLTPVTSAEEIGKFSERIISLVTGLSQYVASNFDAELKKFFDEDPGFAKFYEEASPQDTAAIDSNVRLYIANSVLNQLVKDGKVSKKESDFIDRVFLKTPASGEGLVALVGEIGKVDSNKLNSNLAKKSIQRILEFRISLYDANFYLKQEHQSQTQLIFDIVSFSAY
ncbi:MAG: zinc-dependent metalloprotease [Oligoflexales bacterium]|nr:zinc-dependent metalloprotease [Oligoflexales bacterium]